MGRVKGEFIYYMCGMLVVLCYIDGFRIAYLELQDYQAAQVIKDWFDNQ